MRIASFCLAAACGTLLLCSPAISADFQPWITFKGTQLHRDAGTKAYCYVTRHSRIDADGAPNAYHPGDVGKHCINDTHIGLDCPANAGFPGTSWWSSVLAADPQSPSKPFVQPDGPTKGFFVTQSWLFDASKAETDPARYVDATTVPYIVFPGSTFDDVDGSGWKGDVGIAWNLANGKKTAFVVADQGGGPDAKLGEGSIALYEALGGTNVNARTGAGVAPGDMRFLVFPGSRRGFDWPQSVAAISSRAEALLAQVGEQSLADCR